jgi:hypothetical protein
VLQDQRAWPGSRHLLIGGYSLLQGEIDEALLEAALRDLAAEQPALRLLPALSGQRLLAAGEQPVSLWRADFEGTDTDTDRPPAAPHLGAMAARALGPGHRAALARRLAALWRRALGHPAAGPPQRARRLGQRAVHAPLVRALQRPGRRRGATRHRRRGLCAPPAGGPGLPRRSVPPGARRRLLGRRTAGPAAATDSRTPRHTPGPRCLPAALLHALPLARADYQRWRGLAASAQQTEFATLAAVLAWQFAAWPTRTRC